MGLLGFITVVAYFDRRFLRWYFRRLVEAIILSGVLGLFGFAFIDNAGHLGGLVAGLLLGWLFLRNKEQGIEKRERLFRFAGSAAVVLLCFIAAFTVYRMV